MFYLIRKDRRKRLSEKNRIKREIRLLLCRIKRALAQEGTLRDKPNEYLDLAIRYSQLVTRLDMLDKA